MFSQNEKYAGLLLVVGGIIYLWSESVGVHYGSTVLVNAGVALLGVLMLVGAYFLQIAFKSTLFTILVVLAGIGTIGVGVLPFGDMTYYAFAYLGYAFFGLSALMSYKFVKSPLNYIFILLGVLSLLGLLLWVSGVDLGGVRASPVVIDYLILPWLVAFGANIIQEQTDSSAKA